MAKKIIIAGATGTIGKNLCRLLEERGDEVTVLTRNAETAKKIIPNAKAFIKWNAAPDENPCGFFEGKDAVINLAGAPVVGKKWTADYKKEILDSRVNPTKAIVEAIGACKNRPAVFLCSSAIGYYGSRNNEVITEKSAPGTDYLSFVCKEWEKEASEVEKFGVRRVSLRTGIVIDKEGGALSKMLPSFRFFLGGYLGDGENWFSWIHWKDLCRIFIFTLDNETIKGGINATAPISDTMAEFSRTLGRTLRRPSFFNVPVFVLKILFGEGANALLSSQRVLPAELNRAGFKFEFVNAEKALTDILKK